MPKAKQRARKLPPKPIGDDPTKETAKKLRADPLKKMAAAKSGGISTWEFLAAEQILDMWEAIESGLTCQAVDLSRPYIDRRGAFSASLERMPTRLQARYRHRWKPWADACSAKKLHGGLTLLELVHRIVVNRNSLREMEDERGVGHGTYLPYLREALTAWADHGVRDKIGG